LRRSAILRHLFGGGASPPQMIPAVFSNACGTGMAFFFN
jgi:hypothetical protein